MIKIPEILEFYPHKNEQFIGLLSIPHSGEYIPEEFQVHLINDSKHLQQDLDYRVHELVDIEKLQSAGIAVLKSNISRVCIDLNRAQDKALFTWKKNSRGVQLVNTAPSDEDSKRMLLKYYSPYFEMIKAALYQLKRTQKTASFVDLHSMPSKATDYHLAINPNQSPERPDFCISDKSGLTCTNDYILDITNRLKKSYTNISNNDPYFGGYITEHVNKYFKNTNNIQIEISRALYMDEENICLVPEKSDHLKANLTKALMEFFNQFA